MSAPQRSSVLRMQVLQIWRTKGQQDWQQWLWKCLFSLKNIIPVVEKVTMAADTFALLSQDDLHFLWQQNLLETILAKLRK